MVRRRAALYPLRVTEHAEPGIDPDDLATTLRVLDRCTSCRPTIPTSSRSSGPRRHVQDRQGQAAGPQRAAEVAADRAVIEATATGSPMRIDDETAGLALVSTARGAFAGELITPRGCYICKSDYTLVDAFYHYLCPTCAAFSHSKRDQRTDLTGDGRCSPAGGPRSGCTSLCGCSATARTLTLTTRFPQDAVRRFSAMPDSPDWMHRLKIVGIDLRDPTQVLALTDDVAADGPLDILINNACQTVRRSPGAYAQLVEMESARSPTGPSCPRW